LSPVFVEKLSNYRKLSIDLESITVPAKYKNLVVVDSSLLS
jgi:cystathionine beta-lyase/cystathionine gamma-synthase